MEKIIWAVGITLALAALLWIAFRAGIRTVRWARKGSPAATVVGWALLFLGAGTNPQPPPQEQVEQANRQRKIKKEAESGDPED
jgi:hypothetical protein